MIAMGALCERSIALAADALLSGNTKGAEEIIAHGHEIDAMEREIIRICQNKAYSKEACRSNAEGFDKDERFGEYLKLYGII